VDITYVSNKLKKQLADPKEVARRYGQLARKINQRHEELKSADNLSILRLFPAAGCHELTGDKKGCLAVNVSGNYRLIFKPNHDPLPCKEDGGLNWEKVTAVTIVEIDDYH
jgi:plasmid maintenance system killer protein